LAVVDLASGKEAWRSPVNAINGVFGHDGAWVAYYDWQARHVCIADARTGKETRRLRLGENVPCNAHLAACPTRAELALLEPTGHVSVRRVADGSVLWRVRGHRHESTRVSGGGAIAYAPSGDTLVTGAFDGMVREWDARTGKPGRVLARGGARTMGLAVSARGVVAASCLDRRVQLFRDGKPGRRLALGSSGQGVAFSPDGSLLAATSRGPHIALWEAATGKRRFPPEGHESAIASLHWEGATLVSQDDGGGLVRWQGDRAKPVAPSRGGVLGPGAWVSPDRGIVVHQAEWDEYEVRDARTGAALRKLEGAKQYLVTGGFSADGKRFGFIDGSGDLVAWDVATGKKEPPSLKLGSIYRATVALSPDLRRAAWKFNDSRPAVFVAEAGKKPRALFDLTTEHVWTALAWSPDGRWLMGCDHERVKLWDGGRVLAKEHGQRSVPWALFSPEGRLLATLADGGIKVWDMATGEIVRGFPGHAGGARCAAFSPDGRVLATGGGDACVVLWDMTGRMGRPGRIRPRLWDDLARDAATAHAAGWELALSEGGPAFLL
ncbi:MAG: PQQ-binding-like beta-propeller repeat protein, partial [Thermoleophilia bacterium]|nr:PQQ-binding-like beta-propeller repeat protein [Thermoleophilia bacterium]